MNININLKWWYDNTFGTIFRSIILKNFRDGFIISHKFISEMLVISSFQIIVIRNIRDILNDYSKIVII